MYPQNTFIKEPITHYSSNIDHQSSLITHSHHSNPSAHLPHHGVPLTRSFRCAPFPHSGRAVRYIFFCSLGRRPCRRPKLQKKDAASIPHAKRKDVFSHQYLFFKTGIFYFSITSRLRYFHLVEPRCFSKTKF